MAEQEAVAAQPPLDGLPPEEMKKRVLEVYRKFHVPEVPTMRGADGIRFDCNFGLRVWIPANARRKYRLMVLDHESNNVICNKVFGANSFYQAKYVWYTEYDFFLFDADTNELLQKEEFRLKDRTVVVMFDVPTVGDVIAWFPAALRFRRETGCRLVVAMRRKMRELISPKYPDIAFIDPSEADGAGQYASYYLTVSLDNNELLNPFPWQGRPLASIACDILGRDDHDMDAERTEVSCSTDERIVAEPYVCIASMASGGCKLWLNPYGWDMVVDFLKKCGYRVLDIDGTKSCGDGFAYQKIPAGAEDMTGTDGPGKSLRDRASLIRDADFFIGLGSGMSWLAWTLGKPVVLISGFSEPWCEFHTPYRVINRHVCHGCFNDVRTPYDNRDCFWCPRQKDFKEKLQCSVRITPRQVIGKVMQIPAFMEHMRKSGLAVKEENGRYEPVPIPNNIDDLGGKAN